MRLFIVFLLLFLSLIIAYIHTSELKRNKNASIVLLRLAEKIKNNQSSEMLPIYKLSEDLLVEGAEEKHVFSSTDDMIIYINDRFKSVPFIKEYSDILSRLPTLAMDELPSCTEKLIKIAEQGLQNCNDKYIKEGKNAYILYPGIVTVLILLLI